jgi:K+-sensing histidine kinase KdpD
MLILNDTTDRVLRIKHLQELDNYKDNLLATVSHDLKTPLNGLSIIANVVKNSIENKEKIKKNEI